MIAPTLITATKSNAASSARVRRSPRRNPRTAVTNSSTDFTTVCSSTAPLPTSQDTLASDRGEAGEADQVNNEHGDAVDAHPQVLAARAENQPGHVHDCQDNAQGGEVDVGVVRGGQHRLTGKQAG